MNKVIIGVSVFGIFLFPVLVLAGNRFSWSMFVPSTTGVGTCDTQNIERCRIETDCLMYGGHWYNEQCNLDVTCSDITGCYFGTMADTCSGDLQAGAVYFSINSDCSFSGVSQYGVQFAGTLADRQDKVFSGSAQTGAYGCGQFAFTCTDNGTSISCDYQYTRGKTGSITNAFQDECRSVNNFLTATLAGYWRFNFTIGSSPFSNNYLLDIDTVEEYPRGSDEFIIYGEGESFDQVSAGYDPGLRQNGLFDPGSVTDIRFAFTYTGANTVAGCYYQYSHSSGIWSYCFPMTGIRLYTSQALGINENMEPWSLKAMAEHLPVESFAVP